MEDSKTNDAGLKTHVTEYAKTYLKLVKVKATQGASNAVSGIAIGITAFFLVFFFFIFFFFALGWWIGGLVNSMALGFFIVAGFFLLLLVLIFALRKKIIVPLIRNTIISKVYE